MYSARTSSSSNNSNTARIQIMVERFGMENEVFSERKNTKPYWMEPNHLLVHYGAMPLPPPPPPLLHHPYFHNYLYKKLWMFFLFYLIINDILCRHSFLLLRFKRYIIWKLYVQINQSLLFWVAGHKISIWFCWVYAALDLHRFRTINLRKYYVMH